ncbi:hypothetical protein [Plesiomonas shigelloides]
MKGTNKAHENGEAMGFVGVRLTVILGHGYVFLVLHLIIGDSTILNKPCRALILLFGWMLPLICPAFIFSGP